MDSPSSFPTVHSVRNDAGVTSVIFCRGGVSPPVFSFAIFLAFGRMVSSPTVFSVRNDAGVTSARISTVGTGVLDGPFCKQQILNKAAESKISRKNTRFNQCLARTVGDAGPYNFVNVLMRMSQMRLSFLISKNPTAGNDKKL